MSGGGGGEERERGIVPSVSYRGRNPLNHSLLPPCIGGGDAQPTRSFRSLTNTSSSVWTLQPPRRWNGLLGSSLGLRRRHRNHTWMVLQRRTQRPRHELARARTCFCPRLSDWLGASSNRKIQSSPPERGAEWNRMLDIRMHCPRESLQRHLCNLAQDYWTVWREYFEDNLLGDEVNLSQHISSESLKKKWGI